MFIGTGETRAAAPAVQGNGFVRHNQGQLFGGALVAVAPIGLRNPDGLGGPPTFSLEPRAGLLAGADGNSTADQAIPLRGGREFLIRSIIACHARGTPSAQLLAGLYTLPGKAGIAVVPQRGGFQALTDDGRFLQLLPAPVLLQAPFLYWSPSVVNGTAVTFDIVVHADIVTPLTA
ncbi:hypothetical protein KXR53_22475 [Inquilinus limosus]|uniref:hypothetical protein n=1 Tax=Inquilinus limosus TaxID=171674 RepID=UPI003F18BCE9